MLHKELQQRFAAECRYATTKMLESPEATKKLFYFSVIFGEAQRLLNWQWDRDIALIHLVSQQAYTVINAQLPFLGSVLPIKGEIVFEKLTKAVSDLADYLEKTENKDSQEELCQILARFAEITYVVQGNGSYLYEKGLIDL